MLPRIVSPADAHSRAKAGALIIDVREEDEYAEARVPGAPLIPLDAVGQRVGEIPKDRDVILICRSGRRSGIAQQYLLDRGYERVANLDGGILAWEEAGLPVERG